MLHQLVDYLRKRNKDAYIYYYDNPQLGVLAAYTKYEVAVAEHVDDVEGNVAVLPEICFSSQQKLPACSGRFMVVERRQLLS